MKGNKLRRGDLFLVELEDKTFGLGMFFKHSLKPLNSYICCFFSERFSSMPTEAEINDAPLIPISLQFVTRDLLDNGVWQIVGRRQAVFSDDQLPDEKYIQAGSFKGARVIGSGIMRKFLNAYHGLLPWNMMANDDYFEELLLEGAPRPTKKIEP